MEFEYMNKKIKFEIEFRKRKTMELRIIPPDTVLVIAPKGLSKKIILERVVSKGKWISDKLSIMEEREVLRKDKKYVGGEKFLYLGKEYSLLIIEDCIYRKPKAELYEENIIIYTNNSDEEYLKKSLELWYREKTAEKVLERMEIYQKYFSDKPNSIKVKEQKKRWGTCTSRRDLYFNWRCSMAPIFVLDYIIVHEMCHIIHMNHSKEYWQLVEKIMPEYKKSKKWLKDFGILMDL